jgi:uncharacterized protein (TIGR03000 family)
VSKIAFSAAIGAALVLGLPGIGLAQRGGGGGHGGGGGGGHGGSMGGGVRSSSMGSFSRPSSVGAVNNASSFNNFTRSSAATTTTGPTGPNNFNSFTRAGTTGFHSSNFHDGHFHDGHFHDGHFHSFPYWYPWVGFGLALGLPLFQYAWGWSPYNYGYGAPYYSGGYYYGPVASYSTPADTYAQDPYATQPPPTDTQHVGSHEYENPNVANVEIRVPENATVWIQGQKAEPTGAVRHFYSPPLEKGQTYTYEMHARWTDANGNAVERRKQLDVKAGAWLGVDFNQEKP